MYRPTPLEALHDPHGTIIRLLAELEEARARIKELETWIANKDYDLVEEGLVAREGNEDEEWGYDGEAENDGDEA